MIDIVCTIWHVHEIENRGDARESLDNQANEN